ncbi:nitrilase-related carbon-nitrogen hydrolase [Roseibium litorale]|uniref:Nitrilase n=1 Tax=Roseibium litorale TaxID=2803841 RepID=A0ABR9CGZ8_9HYPH|nr:nitrilase-related carbon-nitrogen hydrolase [Roseibium litorale]MBD8889989.1 nitrilase [Roseibium litorale]
MQDYTIALWSLNAGVAPASLEAFIGRIEEKMLAAKAEGSKLLMMPEYAIEACLAFKPEGLEPTKEMAFLASVAKGLIQGLKPLVKRHGISVLAGSLPVALGEGHTNTAVLLTADGREIRQDKLSLTPGEKDPDSWMLTGGTRLGTFELDGLKMAILICLDVEMPAHSSLLALENIDLLLVPSMTSYLSGYHRVFDCAKARAVELMTSVAVCGVVGASPASTQNDTNVSGAALYVPCEEELGFTGVAASIAPTGGESGEEPFLIANVPVDSVRKLRGGAAEVWPGAWSAAHVCIGEAAIERF